MSVLRHSRELGAALAIVMLSVAAPTEAVAASIYRVIINGTINPATSDYIESGLATAAGNGAAGLAIQMDTPGGLLESTKTIVKNILAAPIPVFVYVAPSGGSATSAGVFITLAGNIAAMAPGTTIGAAHPVTGQGGDIEGDMRQKVENFAVSFIESIAERRGRNVKWSEQAVRESVSITESEAAELGVIDFVAADMGELLDKAQGLEIEVAGENMTLDFSDVSRVGGAPVVIDIEMTFRQQVLDLVAHPNVAYFLMMGAMLGLYMEFSNPGTLFPGVVGAICLLLALLAFQVLPISSAGVLLIVLGMAFLLGELLMPSFGMLGFGGLIALTLGSLILYTPESGLIVDRSLIFSTVVVFGGALLLIVFVLVKDRRRRPSTGAEGLIGEIGVSVTPVQAAGKVKVHGELWNATSAEPIEPDRPVTIEAVNGLRVTVRERQE
ncbi:MAG: nodulation protein NfeD [Myxococcales bacterium]|nr:MAG: nodulation protein NfeD [Myxococcales bacterium]